MHAAIHTMTETKPEENMAVIFNEILEVIHCHTAFISVYDTFIRISFFFNPCRACSFRSYSFISLSLSFYIYIYIYIYIYKLYIEFGFFLAHLFTVQQDTTSVFPHAQHQDNSAMWPLQVYKQEIGVEWELWRAGRGLNPDFSPRNAEEHWDRQSWQQTLIRRTFAICTARGEVARERGDTDDQPISRMTHLTLLTEDRVSVWYLGFKWT